MPVTLLEPVSRYEVELELRRATPRRVRYSVWPGVVIATCISLYALLLLCAVFVATRSAELLWLARCGDTARAKVLGCAETGSDGGCVKGALDSPAAQIALAFTARRSRSSDGSPSARQMVYTTSPIDASAIASAQAPLGAGMPHLSRPSGPSFVAMRYGWWYGRLIYAPQASLQPRSSWLSILFAVFITAITTFLFARWILWLVSVRHLLRYGHAVIGTIVDKEITESDIPRYFVAYGYLDPEGVARQRRERCTPDQWRRLLIGQPVTLLCLGEGNGRCAVYAHMPLRCA